MARMTRLSAVAAEGESRQDFLSPPGLADHIRSLRRRWWLPATTAALAVALALGLSLTSPSRYDATTKLVFGSGDPVESVGDSRGVDEDPERVLKTNAELIAEENIAQRVIDRLSLGLPADELLDNVETDTEQDSDIVALRVRDENPEQAAAIANAFAQEYVAFRREAGRRNLDEAAGLARERLESLTDLERNSAQGEELQARLRELEIAAALQTGGVQLVRPATPPDERATPRPLLAGIAAGIVGLLLGAGLAIGFAAFDRRIRSEDEIEELFGLPLLAGIPRGKGRSGLEGPDQHEGYASLATNLRFFKLGPEINTLLVASPSAGEGKTSVTLGLARALTAMGQRVVAIEADLRQPAFAKNVAVPRPSGLSSILAGVSTFSDELIELDMATKLPVDPGQGGGASFWVLPGGPVPPNPQGLLSTDTIRDVLSEATAFADIVLIDTPPAAVVNDAVTLVDLVDGVVLVIQMHNTTRDRARRALRLLANLHAPLLGVVATNVRPRTGGYYGGYAAGSAAARSEPPRRFPLARGR